MGFIHTIKGGGISQATLEDEKVPRENVERLARYMNKHGADIRIDSSLNRKQLASSIYWSMVPPTCTMY